MKVAGWLLIALGIVLVPVAFVLNATFASTRFIDDVLWIDTSWTATGSIVPLVVAAMSAVAIATGIAEQARSLYGERYAEFHARQQSSQLAPEEIRRAA